MSILQWPLDLPVHTQEFGVAHFEAEFSNPDTGGGQVAILGPRRLTCGMTSEDKVHPDRAALWRQVIFALNGRVNQLAVWDVLHPVPRGTLRGVLAAAEAAVAGASTLRINAGANQAGRTLVRGDWIGVHQTSAGAARQLLPVQAPATVAAGGLVVVDVGIALRAALPAGSAIAWERPTCLMRQTTTTNKWTSQGARQSGFSLDLQERWE